MFSPAETQILAGCLVALLLLALAAYVVVQTRPWPISWFQSFWYAVNVFLARVYWRGKVVGRLSLPPGQGAVLVCNHRSPIDPAFIQMMAPRPMHWMVAREYTTHWAIAWFFRMAEVIPVGRNGIDTAATRAAIRFAQQGGLVGLFPEGRINTTENCLLPCRPGAALIALRARVPVVPCFVRGTRFAGTVLGSVLLPAHVTLTLGQPMDISEFFGREDDRQVLEEVTRRFLREIARLGGCPDFQPQVVRSKRRET